MKVVEIFNSIEGEGKRAGLPATFIRLFGCNLRCSYCDSMYAVEGADFKEMSVDEILEAAEEIGCPNITITGGEPLIHKDITNLLESLCKRGYWINVETNGSIVPEYRTLDSRLFYTIDYKTSSSGMKDKMSEKAFESLRAIDVVKFVVGSEEDLQEAMKEFLRIEGQPTIYVSPIFGKIDPKDIVDFVLRNKLWNWKVQLQLHKFIWNPEERGV